MGTNPIADTLLLEGTFWRSNVSPRELVLDAEKSIPFRMWSRLAGTSGFSVGDRSKARRNRSIPVLGSSTGDVRESGSPDELVKAKYAFRDAETIKKDTKNIDRLIRDRMVAAKVAIAFLQRASGHRPKLPSNIKRLSINQLAEWVKNEANQSIPENFKTRVWRPSVPVIYLAAAVGVAINDRELKGEMKTSYGNIIAEFEFLFDVLRYSKEYELIIRNSDLPINADKLISIRLVQ